MTNITKKKSTQGEKVSRHDKYIENEKESQHVKYIENVPA